MRVAYLTGEYPRATDVFIQREVATMRREGVYVQVFSIRRPAADHCVGPEQQAEQRRTIYVLPCSPIRLLAAHLGVLLRSPRRYLLGLGLAVRRRPAGLRGLLWHLFYFAEAAVVANAFRRHRLDHLHNHFADSSCSVAMLAAVMGGFTFSFTIHGPGEFFAPQQFQLGEKARRALFVCCISHFCRSQMMLWAPPESWSRLHIVHCGIDPDLFDPNEHRDKGSHLLFVGRLERAKGLPILLEAVAALCGDWPGLHLTIVGDGPDRSRLESRARQLGVEENVTFAGYKSRAEVLQHLRAADVFVMSSLAEGVPVVLMEAMAGGLPVVAPRIAGIPELIEDGVTGLLVPPGDAGALAGRVERLLADGDLRRRLGRAGRAKVEQDYNLRTEVARLKLIMSAALSDQPSPDGAASKHAAESSRSSAARTRPDVWATSRRSKRSAQRATGTELQQTDKCSPE